MGEFARMNAVYDEDFAENHDVAAENRDKLIEKLFHLAAALRLRGGFGRGGLSRELQNLGAGLGTLVLFSVERSQRVYAVMAVRGQCVTPSGAK